MTDTETIKELEKALKVAEETINRQKAEKENLEIEIQAMRNAANGYKAEVERLKDTLKIYHNYNPAIKHAKAEAVKEFAERLKEKAYFHEEYGTMVLENVDEIVDDLVEETVGDADDK